MSYGVFQEYYTSEAFLRGDQSTTGIVGMTFNGIIYISMPLLFGTLSHRWARFRRLAAFFGAALTSLGYFLSSFSTDVRHVVATQAVLAAIGSALMFSPTTLSLGEWYSLGNRALAYGIVLSSKNIVGTICPFLLRALLDHLGFSIALKVWAAIVAASSLFALLILPSGPSSRALDECRARNVPWHFLKHKTFYIYALATLLQSAGYGIPQTYLNEYAHDAAALSPTSTTLLLTLFNLPGILSSSFFGYLSDNKRWPLSAATTTAVSALSSALSALLFWGLAPRSSMALLVLFSISFGFFAGGYSATWGGVINEMEREAADHNEAVDSGVLYGLLNGARGLGYVSGGVAGPALLSSGSAIGLGDLGYKTEYLPLIIFTGLSTGLGGWSVLWQMKKLGHLFS